MVVKMASSVFARGRGRGRGVSSHQQLRRPGETGEQKQESNGTENNDVFNVESLTKVINDLRFNSSDEGFVRVRNQVKGFGTTDEKLKKVVDLLCQKCKDDSEFAPTAVAIANRLCKEDEFGPKFRGFFLKAVQEEYKNRDEIKKKSLTRWIGVVCLISEIFKVLRINDAPLKPLTVPIYVMLSELLSGEENAEQIECFNMQFRDIGKLLESVDKVKMDNLVRVIRDTIVNPKTSAKTRCMLLEMMELKSLNWDMSKEIEKYYAETLADLMEQELVDNFKD